jgi:Na+/H+ antiporter NhaC
MASASDHIDHVKTQLPYALIAGIVAALVYLVIGLVG